MIRSILLSLAICGSAFSQEVVYLIPTQCCPGGNRPYSAPQQYYQQPQQQQRPRQQQFQSPPVGSPGTPKFKPRPTAPAEPAKPADDAGWVPASAEWKAWSKQNDERLQKIEDSVANLKPCNCDHSKDITQADLDKLKKDIAADTAAAIAAIKLKTGPPGPPGKPAESPTPHAESHIVIVADRNASWWQRLAEDITKTKDTYSGIEVTGLPPFPIGDIPQAVVYENSVPVRVVKGEQQVLDLLSRVRRGASI